MNNDMTRDISTLDKKFIGEQPNTSNILVNYDLPNHSDDRGYLSTVSQLKIAKDFKREVDFRENAGNGIGSYSALAPNLISFQNHFKK